MQKQHFFCFYDTCKTIIVISFDELQKIYLFLYCIYNLFFSRERILSSIQTFSVISIYHSCFPSQLANLSYNFNPLFPIELINIMFMYHG